jgi:hypothetical protein
MPAAAKPTDAPNRALRKPAPATNVPRCAQAMAASGTIAMSTVMSPHSRLPST